MSALATKILVSKHGWSDNITVNSWRFFTKNGITLSDLRDKIENTEPEE
ncbi:MAG: hypothetical protein J1F01_08635 [Oscillospiraceae bacterium]|nr:hypothetical protein [Oscillospiraceae bacterium]